MWCFALVNKKNSEIYYDKKGKKTCMMGYVNIDRNELNKREHKQINADIKKFQLSYKKGLYTDLLTGRVFESCPRPKITKILKVLS
jgi:hypothetical protein